MKRLTLLALVLWAVPASAQDTPSACSASYQTCALRVIDGGGYFGVQLVVQGREGLPIAPARRSATLGGLFAANDSAAAYYAKFETHERYADWAGWAGAGLMVSGFIADLLGEGGLFSRSFLLYGGGLALTYGVSVPLQGKATTDLSSAIWWYNQSFVPPR